MDTPPLLSSCFLASRLWLALNGASRIGRQSPCLFVCLHTCACMCTHTQHSVGSMEREEGGSWPPDLRQGLGRCLLHTTLQPPAPAQLLSSSLSSDSCDALPQAAPGLWGWGAVMLQASISFPVVGGGNYRWLICGAVSKPTLFYSFPSSSMCWKAFKLGGGTLPENYTLYLSFCCS